VLSEKGIDARKALSPSTNAIVKPLAVMAARVLGPGRLRLEMIKLAHDLKTKDRVADDGQAIRPDQRAA
jgi:hypothetical protein